MSHLHKGRLAMINDAVADVELSAVDTAKALAAAIEIVAPVEVVKPVRTASRVPNSIKRKARK
jgi:hypothetical protein